MIACCLLLISFFSAQAHESYISTFQVKKILNKKKKFIIKSYGMTRDFYFLKLKQKDEITGQSKHNTSYDNYLFLSSVLTNAEKHIIAILKRNDIFEMMHDIKNGNYGISHSNWLKTEQLEKDNGPNLYSSLVEYTKLVRLKYERLITNEYLKRKKHLESLTKKQSGILDSLSELDGYSTNKELSQLINQEYDNGIRDTKKVYSFVNQLKKKILSYQVSSAALSNGEVAVDDSMLNGTRQIALAGLASLNDLGQNIPFAHTLMHALTFAGIHLIKEKQLNDNKSYFFSTKSMVYSESLALKAVIKILQICSFDEMSKLTPNQIDTLSTTLARDWRDATLIFSTSEVLQDDDIILENSQQSSYAKFVQEVSKANTDLVEKVFSCFLEIQRNHTFYRSALDRLKGLRKVIDIHKKKFQKEQNIKSLPAIGILVHKKQHLMHLIN